MNLKELVDAMMVAKCRMVDDAGLTRALLDPDAEFAHKWEWTDEGRDALRRACRTVLAERQQLKDADIDEAARRHLEHIRRNFERLDAMPPAEQPPDEELPY